MIITDDLGGVWRILGNLGEAGGIWEKLGKSRRSWENLGEAGRILEKLGESWRSSESLEGGRGSKCTLAKSKDFAKVCDVILNFIYTAFVSTALKWGD